MTVEFPQENTASNKSRGSVQKNRHTTAPPVSEEGNKDRDLSKIIAMQAIKDRIEQLKKSTAKTINSEIDAMLDEVLENVEQQQSSPALGRTTQDPFDYDGEIRDKVRLQEGHKLPDKVFLARNSLLTDLLKVRHIESIYHIFLSLFFGMFVNHILGAALRSGTLNLGHRLVFKAFRNFPTLMYIWSCMFLATFLVYVGLNLWATTRIQLSPKSRLVKFWDLGFLAAYVAYIGGYIYFTTTLVLGNNMSVAEAMAAFCEMTRFLMKSHAFVRTNAARSLRYKHHSEDAENQIVCPDFNKFLYFLFIPTLIYQDSYPRTKTIQWNYVLRCFIEVFGCIFFVSFVLERFLVPAFKDYCLRRFEMQELVMAIFEQAIVGLFITLCTFYTILHAWMNGFAEMLRFADRMFYKDWWTSTTYNRYYRTWNVVVHDWLYTYVYKDFYEHVLPNNKIAAKLAVFFISAVFHEYILSFSFQFFYPVMFMQFFGIGLTVSFLSWKNRLIANTGLWYGLGLGTGIMMSTYSMELFARLNLPPSENATFSDYLIPKSLFCNPP